MDSWIDQPDTSLPQQGESLFILVFVSSYGTEVRKKAIITQLLIQVRGCISQKQFGTVITLILESGDLLVITALLPHDKQTHFPLSGTYL